MTLTAHSIVGASIASIMPSNPVLGFVAGFASHFLLDAIPHWDYSLVSSKRDGDNPMNDEIFTDKGSVFDLFKISFDGLLGVSISLLLFGVSNYNLVWTPIWGMIGALTPDFLQLVYFKFWRGEPMKSLHEFHVIKIHAKEKFVNHPVLGISLQIAIIFLVVVISKFLFK